MLGKIDTSIKFYDKCFIKINYFKGVVLYSNLKK